MSPKQFAVIREMLRSGQQSSISGKSLREGLREAGQRGSLASFYELMARCEDLGFLRGKWRSIDRDRYGRAKTRERVYSLTATGARVYDATRQYFVESPQASGVARGA